LSTSSSPEYVVRTSNPIKLVADPLCLPPQRDTTAQALSWTYFQLIAQPELFKPLQKEVDEAETIDYDNFKDLTQILATFNEVRSSLSRSTQPWLTGTVYSQGMRLHPSVPKNIKTAVADDQIPNGPFIRAGEMVVWNDWSMGRSTDVWGPDACEFKPSRWIDDAGELMKVSQWKGHWCVPPPPRATCR
jgi:cytochrome P450